MNSIHCDTLIIDAPYLSHRSYDAPYPLARSDGLKVTQIHSFIRSTIKLNRELNPGKIYITWESHGTPSWRRQLYPDYKPSVKIPDSFIEQRTDIKRLLYKAGVTQYYSPTNEADDVIATLVEKAPVNDKIIIFTVDKDIMQLISDNVSLYTGKELVERDGVRKKFGVSPSHLGDLLAITGDPSDNIPGVFGYGPKKASKLLDEYGHIESFSKELIESFKPIQLDLNKKLVTLNHHCELIELEYENSYTIESILDKYELHRLKNEISKIKGLSRKPISLSEFY